VAFNSISISYSCFTSARGFKNFLNSISGSNRLLGTPNEEMWPGLATHKYWHGHKYPQWSPGDLSEVVPNMDSHGLDLLSVSCCIIHN
jgi:hypothetical protein